MKELNVRYAYARGTQCSKSARKVPEPIITGCQTTPDNTSISVGKIEVKTKYMYLLHGMPVQVFVHQQTAAGNYISSLTTATGYYRHEIVLIYVT